MKSISAKLSLSHLHFHILCTSNSARLSTSRIRVPPRAAKVSNLQLKEKWLDSLSLNPLGGGEGVICASETQWVLGVDPDVSGAVALLKPEVSGSSAQVFDTPNVKLLVGKTVRNRLDARSIVQLLQTFGAPYGTKAYIEQSNPFPQDGKQGWWSGGYTYGMWTGILVASGFSVVPVTSHEWKNHFALSRSSSSKDDSREVASALFPSLSCQLKRKKDHGRAEALLIAAYGRSLIEQLEPS
ncbi:hypothetical protein J5N97_014444 [Dioscorea zingiberensis]|uniref:Uncharacterized protein n=1 Tax=Dioscorea zingiberensis TaxID=325984 RepID=A0A9D5CVB0_9LILI|nr:hypothetical protein J5N97_014444 [Dioscorea zingiberensis]